MGKSGWFHGSTLLIGLCVATTLAASIPAGISVSQLVSLRSGIEDINKANRIASRARHVQEIIGHSQLSLMAIAVDLSPDERQRVLDEGDRQFAMLGRSVDTLVSMTDGFISDSLQQALRREIADVTHGWGDIRETSQDQLDPAERTFHFLRLIKEVRDARAILSAIELHADAASIGATQVAFAHVQQTNILLICVIAAVTIIIGLVAYGGIRFARSVREANIDLQDKNQQIEARDRAITAQNARFTVALDNMSQGLCMFGPDKRLVVCNPRYIAMYTLPERLGQPGTHFREILEHRVTQGCSAATIRRPISRNDSTPSTRGCPRPRSTS